MGQKTYTLLTGATGLLGQFLLTDLMRARLPVAVLVRPGRERDAARRIDRQLCQSEKRFGRNFPRPVVFAGEMTAPGLGLSGDDRTWLREHCQRVLHSAAYISFKPADSHPDGEPFRTNVEGTRQLAELCLDLGIREFHQISSAFACGIREGLVLESDGAVNQKFSNDYEASKCASEELLRELRGLESLTIYRPSIIVDPTPGSLPVGDRTIYLAFSVYQLLAQRIGLPEPSDLLNRLGLDGNERKNIVPVAWVSREIVQILRRKELHTGTYHLTHPVGTTLIDLVTVFHDVLAAAGHKPLSGKLMNADFGELAGLVDQFIETFTPYFRDDPQFDQTQLLRALAACGEPNCPDVDREMLANIARQQMGNSSKPAENTVVSAMTKWAQWVAAVGAPHGQFPAAGACHFGLILTGPEGGDWQLGIDETGRLTCFGGGGEDVNQRIYTSSQTWDQILQKQLTPVEALQQGRLLLECGSGEFADTTLIEDFQRLLEVVEERVCGHQGVRKVSLHGS